MSNIIFRLSQLGKFWQDSLNQQVLRYTIVVIVFEIIYLFLRFNAIPPQVPLFFTLPWGERQLASTSLLFLLPGFTVLVVFINFFLAISVSAKSQLFGKLLVVFSLIFSFVTAIALVQIIRLVT